MLICTEIGTKNDNFLDRKLTRLLLPRPLKRMLFALLEMGYFQIAKAGSILRADRQRSFEISILG